ncbi:MAG: hypothetical protein LBH61_05335 [Dysgonamonadaceae bacterium]|jgi:hypothetical protein|nr:hypothetical protein [Dysgonamonadaceae bacterium]
MEEILIAILDRIQEKVAGLSLIDEDTGQLEAEEDSYPVTFPCVFVGNTDINWSDVGLGVQKGDTQLTVRLAIDCYDDTHIGSGTTDKIRERQQLSTEVYKALQGFRINKYMGPMVRVKSRDYTIPGNVKVYEKIFKFYYHDESAKRDNPLRP